MIAAAITFGLIDAIARRLLLQVVRPSATGKRPGHGPVLPLLTPPATRSRPTSGEWPRGIRSTFQNAGMTVSIGLFFAIMVVGLASSLPAALTHGLMAQGLSSSAAAN
jgi:hypothetical protein